MLEENSLSGNPLPAGDLETTGMLETIGMMETTGTTGDDWRRRDGEGDRDVGDNRYDRHAGNDRDKTSAA
ncbi:hypothetical protein D3C87_2161770 [compost metagenome]